MRYIYVHVRNYNNHIMFVVEFSVAAGLRPINICIGTFHHGQLQLEQKQFRISHGLNQDRRNFTPVGPSVRCHLFIFLKIP